MTLAVKNVLVLPGLFNSYLDNLLPSGRLGRRFYYTVPGIAQNYIRYLQLQADGVTPSIAINGSIVANWYTPGNMDALVNTLTAAPYNVSTVAYDWRLDITATAAKLLTKYAGQFTAPFAVVAHSQGGLVARSMFQQAGLGSPFQNNLKRMVTLGTPHWGSYAAVQSLTHLSSYYGLIASFAAPTAYTPTQILAALLTSNPFGFLDQVIASWPAIYQLCPNPAQANDVADPGRNRVPVPANYTGGSFGNNFVSAPWFADAEVFWSSFGTAATQPVSPVLVCVRGSGFPTDGTLDATGSLFLESSYASEDGDGVVTVNAATLGTQGLQTVASKHGDIPLNPSVVANIVGWIEGGSGSSTVPVAQPGQTQSPAVTIPFKQEVFPNTVVPPPPPVSIVPPLVIPLNPPIAQPGAAMPANCPTSTGTGQTGVPVSGTGPVPLNELFIG